MTGTTLQLRRDTEVNVRALTGSQGELLVDTDNDQVILCNGIIVGGKPIARESQFIGTTIINFTTDADYTLSYEQNMHYKVQVKDPGTLLTTTRKLLIAPRQSIHLIDNQTAQDLEVEVSSNPGTSSTAESGKLTVIACDGTDCTADILSFVHNSAVSLQGGTTGQYYHLTSAAYNALMDANAQLTNLQTDGTPTFTTVYVNTINEKTAANGVIIDGVLLKDTTIKVNTITEKTTNNGVSVEAVLIKDGGVNLAASSNLKTDLIAEVSSAAGVTIDGVLIKDGGVNCNSNKVTGVATPTTGTDATNKTYVDNALVNDVVHNNTSGKQGGTTGQYYHVTSAVYTAITDANAQLTNLQTGGTPTFVGLNLTVGSNGSINLNSGGYVFNTPGTAAAVDFTINSRETASDREVFKIVTNYAGTPSTAMSVRGNNYVYLNGQLDLGSSKITGVAGPTADSDAATKGYVDSVSGSPSVTHNDTSGLQGGTTGQYYHLTSAAYSNLTGGSPSFNAVRVNNTFVSDSEVATFQRTSNGAQVPTIAVINNGSNPGTGAGIAFVPNSNIPLGTIYCIRTNSPSVGASDLAFRNYNGTSLTENFLIKASGQIYFTNLGSGSTYEDVQLTAAKELIRIVSSRRYKQNIEEYYIDPNKLLELNLKSFQYKPEYGGTGETTIGLIAEEVEKTYPNLVTYAQFTKDRDGKYIEVKQKESGAFYIENRVLLDNSKEETPDNIAIEEVVIPPEYVETLPNSVRYSQISLLLIPIVQGLMKKQKENKNIIEKQQVEIQNLKTELTKIKEHLGL